jgi:hypothetical protein
MTWLGGLSSLWNGLCDKVLEWVWVWDRSWLRVVGWCISNLAPSGACCLPRLALSLLLAVCLDTMSSCGAATLPATAAD